MSTYIVYLTQTVRYRLEAEGDNPAEAKANAEREVQDGDWNDRDNEVVGEEFEVDTCMAGNSLDGFCDLPAGHANEYEQTEHNHAIKGRFSQ